MKTYGEVEVKIHAFFTNTLNGGERSASCSGWFILREIAQGTDWI
jgi:hypothetical protein